MDGEIIYFDAARGTGFITGTDGNRYVFDRSDLNGPVSPSKGDRASFRPEGDRARAIVLAAQADGPVQYRRSVPTLGGTGIPLAEGDSATAPTPNTPIRRGVLGHFRHAVTSGYADFRGRASRREFWSFSLLAVAVIIVAAFAGVFADFASGNLYEIETERDFAFDGEPWLTMLILGGTLLALALPLVAVAVRRIHDIGLSGWFVLLGFVPSIGNIIMLGFSLWPGVRGPNKWGPAPN